MRHLFILLLLIQYYLEFYKRPYGSENTFVIVIVTLSFLKSSKLSELLINESRFPIQLLNMEKLFLKLCLKQERAILLGFFF